MYSSNVGDIESSPDRDQSLARATKRQLSCEIQAAPLPATLTKMVPYKFVAEKYAALVQCSPLSIAPIRKTIKKAVSWITQERERASDFPSAAYTGQDLCHKGTAAKSRELLNTY